MNKKVIKVMLALVVVFLAAYYVLKCFFPAEFILMIETPGLVAAGNFIDNHVWLTCIMGIGIGILFDYFYFGAVCQQVKLNWKLFIIIVLYNIAYTLFVNLAPLEIVMNTSNILIIVANIYMILLPVMFTKQLLPLSVTYSINSVAQLLTLSIRDIGLLMLNMNSLTVLCMSFECYLWMLLCFMLFNYKQKEVV